MPAQILHHRTLIRRAVVTVLRNAANQPLRIKDSKVTPHVPEQLPIASVRSGPETVVSADEYDGARVLQRELAIQVEIVRAANTQDGVGSEEALAEILDSDCRSVELAVAEFEDLNGLCQHIVLASTELRYEIASNTPLGIALLTFTATYEAPGQETLLPEFTLGTVRWDLAPPDGTTDAEDTLDVEE